MRCFKACFGASLLVQSVKNLPAMQETAVQSLGQEDPLEKEMTIHSSTIAWKIPWTEEPDRLQSVGLQRVGNDWTTSLSLFTLSQRTWSHFVGNFVPDGQIQWSFISYNSSWGHACKSRIWKPRKLGCQPYPVPWTSLASEASTLGTCLSTPGDNILSTVKYINSWKVIL